MAPEIRNSENPHNFLVDLWSLGVVLFEMLHKKLPYPYNEEEGMVDFKREKLEISAEVDSQAKNLMESLLRIEPEKRLPLRDILKHPWILAGEKQKKLSNNLLIEQSGEESKLPTIVSDKNLRVYKDEFSSSFSNPPPPLDIEMISQTKWKIASWNIGTLTRILKESCLRDFLQETKPDILFLLEIRIDSNKLLENIALSKSLQEQTSGYSIVFNCGQTAGHYGAILVLINTLLSSPSPVVQMGMSVPKYDAEGRIITLHSSNLSIIGVYAPRAASSPKIVERTNEWNPAFLHFIESLSSAGKKNLLIIGDLNVSHTEMDISENIPLTKRTGCSEPERAMVNDMLKLGFVDTFRHLHPSTRKWTQLNQTKPESGGRRLDYALLLTDGLIDQRLQQSIIRDDIKGSDHFPIVIEFDLSL